MDNPDEIQDFSQVLGSTQSGDASGEASGAMMDKSSNEQSHKKDNSDSKSTTLQTSGQQQSIPSDLDSLYKRIDSYDWQNDKVYQRALQNMSQSANLTPYELELRAKCFYWTRKTKTQVDFSDYKEWKLAREQASSATIVPQESNKSQEESSTASHIKSQEPPAPYPSNFSEVAALITSGQGHLIPGIKQIPPTVLADKVTPPSVELRKKPWESNDSEPPVTGGMFGDRRDVYIQQEM